MTNCFRMLVFSSDDKTCNHTFHCPVGNSVPEKAIQASRIDYKYSKLKTRNLEKSLKSFLSELCSQKIKFSLSILILGVGIASITDLQLNFVGTILSLLAIITTCVGQIVFLCFFYFLYLFFFLIIKLSFCGKFSCP